MDNNKTLKNNYISTKQTNHISSMSSETLSICTEGLGFESFDDVEEVMNEGYVKEECTERAGFDRKTFARYKDLHLSGCGKRSRITGAKLPPPIGKPWVCLKSFRENGRFILKEVKIPTQELLYACREDGRLKLRFIQRDHVGKD
ncbi:protein FAF-like, chloroplastic [Artemisia annua]|uniref:Protein FAF-like, chloroplastic n=1 Tax=Artemisia annua TaxID=35608 RepID=A0A2U1QNM4_ARTAN|nr:protein FAF-like, chloroplastic [Artemisia annua]